jgi:hypothetical protein
MFLPGFEATAGDMVVRADGSSSTCYDATFEDTTVTSLKRSHRIASRSNLVILAALLLGPMLAHGVARAAEASTSNTWTDRKIEAAFHDVLAHGDLSDFGFLARTLGLDLEVVQWEKASSRQKESIETHAMAKGVPSYLIPYGTSYRLIRNNKDGTTRINFSFAVKSCPDLSRWGMDWNQQVYTSEGMATDGGPASRSESIRWQHDVEGIVLKRVADSNGSCSFALEQDRHAALSVPEPPTTTPGSGTELLEQVIDLVVAGDLRDYLATARILHTEMSTHGRLNGHRLYDGSATPEQVIPGTDTRSFWYYVNDTGWTETGGVVGVYTLQPSPRRATLRISVDTVANCISPESLEARMRQRHIRFRKKSDHYLHPYLRTFRLTNALSIHYSLQGSCIEEFDLDQETEFAHGTP